MVPSRRPIAVFGSHQPEHISLVGCLGSSTVLPDRASHQLAIEKEGFLDIPIKRIYDLPEVKVYGGDLEKAIKRFNRKVREAGIFGLLKDRRLRPTGAMRKKQKRKAAVARLKNL